MIEGSPVGSSAHLVLLALVASACCGSPTGGSTSIASDDPLASADRDVPRILGAPLPEGATNVSYAYSESTYHGSVQNAWGHVDATLPAGTCASFLTSAGLVPCTALGTASDGVARQWVDADDTCPDAPGRVGRRSASWDGERVEIEIGY